MILLFWPKKGPKTYILFRLQLQCKFQVFRHHPQCNSFCWLRCWQGLIFKFETVGVNSFPSLHTIPSNYFTFIFSVVHVLVLKVVEVIIAAENVRLLMVELSWLVTCMSGIGSEHACPNECGKDVWSLRWRQQLGNLKRIILTEILELLTRYYVENVCGNIQRAKWHWSYVWSDLTKWQNRPKFQR